MSVQQQQHSSSVNDYASQEALREALCGCDNLNWMLPSYDPDTTNVQCMHEELKRLQVLKSYSILDSRPEEDYERITRLATRIFNVPIALVSLVDLGRQWFKSNRGLADNEESSSSSGGGVRETPRSLAFCAHAIQSKMDCFIVPDALQDFRFQNSALVKNAPYIRFYAGAPLICPEGYKLGTLCVIDPKPRPEGLNQDEIETLKDLATMVVKAMVDRRERLLDKQQDPAKLIAYTAHDLLTPLSAAQLSLSLLKDDPNIADALNAQQLEMISTASTCSDLMVRICQATLQSLRQRQHDQQFSSTRGTEYTTASVTADGSDDNHGKKSLSIAILPELVKRLRTILEPIPMQVPVIITLDPDTPKAVVSDDLKLFRSALNLLFHGIGRTAHGKVHLRIFTQNEKELVFECEDTSDVVIPLEQQKILFQPGILMDEQEDEELEVDLGLSSMVSHVHSLQGTYGFRSRTINQNQAEYVEEDQGHIGSIFWFRIPLIVAPEGYEEENLLQPTAAKPTACMPCLHHALVSSGSCTSLVSLGSSCILHKPQHNERGGEGAGTDRISSGGISTPDVREQAYSLGGATRIGETNYPKESREHRKSWTASFSTALSSAGAFAPPRRKRALIIEDSLVIRKTLERALSKLDFDVSQAVNGLEGLEKLKETLFDFVLLDFLMPVMDGLDCAKQYRVWENENRPSFRQWIVGISAHVSVEASEQGLQAGMDGFYPKPIAVKTLKEIQSSKAVVARSKLLDELESAAAGTTKPNFVKEFVNCASCYNDYCPSDSTTSANTSTTRSDNDVTPSAENDQDASRTRSARWVCLIAMETSMEPPRDFVACLSRNGWKCSVAHGEQDALNQLQTRNWDIVLMMDCGRSRVSSSSSLSAVTLVQKFRKWETKNRVNEQKNIFLVICDSSINNDIPDPRDGNSIVQPPSGFDGVLQRNKSVDLFLEDLEYMMNKRNSSSQHKLNIVVCQ